MLAQPVVLASASSIRSRLLEAAKVPHIIHAAAIDEDAYRQSLQTEGAAAIAMATTLAEMKAQRVSRRYSDHLVIGCDQILEFEDQAYAKVSDIEAARKFLQRLRGHTHQLHSAAVVCENSNPIWRAVSSARVTFRSFSDAYLEDYLQRSGSKLLASVGCYHIEGEGIRLVADLSGDFYAVLGLPMTALLGYLVDRGY